MSKGENKNFEDLEPLFMQEGVEIDSYSDEEMLKMLKNPSELEELPLGKEIVFWRNVAERAKESKDFREKVKETIKRDT